MTPLEPGAQLLQAFLAEHRRPPAEGLDVGYRLIYEIGFSPAPAAPQN